MACWQLTTISPKWLDVTLLSISCKQNSVFTVLFTCWTFQQWTPALPPKKLGKNKNGLELQFGNRFYNHLCSQGATGALSWGDLHSSGRWGFAYCWICMCTLAFVSTATSQAHFTSKERLVLLHWSNFKLVSKATFAHHIHSFLHLAIMIQRGISHLEMMWS